MAKKKVVKTKWFGVRADEELLKELAEYADAADMTMSQVIRAAIKEYIWAHPTPKRPKKIQEPDKLIKADEANNIAESEE